MNERDQSYIEDRLLDPGSGTYEAVERLRKLGMNAEADEIMAAYMTYKGRLRQIRDELFYPERLG